MTQDFGVKRLRPLILIFFQNRRCLTTLSYLFVLLKVADLVNVEQRTYDMKNDAIDLYSKTETITGAKFKGLEIPLSNRNIRWKSRSILQVEDASSSSLQNKDLGSLVGAMAWMALEDNSIGCHFLLVTTDTRHPFVDHVMRLSYTASQPIVLVDVERHREEDSDHLLKAMWGEDNTVCRVALIDLTSGKDDLVLKFLGSHQITKWPETLVVAVGPSSKVRDTLLNEVFRNTLQPIYLGFRESVFASLQRNEKVSFSSNDESTEPRTSAASVYSRCLYCKNGDPYVQFLFLWPLGFKIPQSINPFPDQHLNTLGHFFRVVCMPTFPYNARKLDSNESATTITLLDSLDKRLLETMSAHLNFTYETRAPWDHQWGVPTPSGNFTGIVGTLQYNKADFTTTVAPTLSRSPVLDTTRAYHSDPLSVVSLKPQLLPQYMVIVRPFTGWGSTLWLLQRIHFQLFGNENEMSFGEAIFYSWAVILEDPPRNPPKNITGQVLVGIWLTACLVITTGFRAALVPHLAVQLKTKPVDSFRDLVNQGGFQWGIESRYLTGLSRIFFETTFDPDAKHIYKHIEHLPSHAAAFDKIIKGKYGFICYEKLSHTLIDSYYTDDVGNTPFYVSKEGYSLVPYFGWGFGKGAPFRDRFNMVMNRVNEAGIIDFWTDDVMARKVRENRKALRKDGKQKTSDNIPKKEGDDTVKLRIVHMIGVFLVYFLGCGISLAALFVERSTIILKKNL